MSHTSRSSPKMSRSFTRAGVAVTLRSPPAGPITVSSIARPCPSSTAAEHVLPVLHGPAIQRHDLVAGGDSHLGGGAVGRDATDDGRHGRPSHDHEHEGEDDGGEDEVHSGPGKDDEEARDERLPVEGLGRIHRRARAALERILVVAHHLHVAAHGDEGETVLGLLAPVAPQHRAEADGEALHAHAAQPRHHEMPQLVDDDEDADHDDERQDRRHVAILPAGRGAEGASAGSHPATARRVSASTSTHVSISASPRAGTCARARSIS